MKRGLLLNLDKLKTKRYLTTFTFCHYREILCKAKATRRKLRWISKGPQTMLDCIMSDVWLCKGHFFNFWSSGCCSQNSQQPGQYGWRCCIHFFSLKTYLQNFQRQSTVFKLFLSFFKLKRLFWYEKVFKKGRIIKIALVKV